MITQKQTFYIATRGNTEGIARMRALVERLVALGYVHSYDWGKDIEEARAKGYASDDVVPKSFRVHCAEKDWEAATSSLFTIYLTPPPGVKSEGAASELTAAITAARMRAQDSFIPRPCTIVVGKPTTIFADLADLHFATDDDVVDYLAKRMRQLSVLR